MLKALCIEQKRKGTNSLLRVFGFSLHYQKQQQEQITLQKLSVKEEKYVPIDSYSSPLSR